MPPSLEWSFGFFSTKGSWSGLELIFHLLLTATWKKKSDFECNFKSYKAIQLPKPIWLICWLIYEIQNGLSTFLVTTGMWKIRSCSQNVRTSPRNHTWTFIQMLTSPTPDLMPISNLLFSRPSVGGRGLYTHFHGLRFLNQGEVTEPSTVISLIIKTALSTQLSYAIWKKFFISQISLYSFVYSFIYLLIIS